MGNSAIDEGMTMKNIELVGAIEDWRRHLVRREAAPATVEKYVREARHLLCFLRERDIGLDRDSVLAYKANLVSRRAPAGANAAIAAVNGFLTWLGLPELRLARLKVQPMPRAASRGLSCEDYRRLTARAARLDRDALVAQALCSTGIRVSELRFLTVEALHAGSMVVNNKGKARRVWLPRRLCRRLLAFALRSGVHRGPVFVTRSGRALDRTRVWRILKGLARRVGVDCSRVFPHALRHLFAATFQRRHGDIEALAHVLGHARVETTRIYLAEDELERRRQVECLGLS